MSAGDRYPSGSGQSGQRLAPEAETADIQEVRAVDFRRRVAGQRQGQFVGRDAVAVVGDAQKGFPARGLGDVDAVSACVERVFDQLFEGRCGAFHHFASGDAVDCGLIQEADGLGAYLGVTVGHDTRFSITQGDSTSGRTG